MTKKERERFLATLNKTKGGYLDFVSANRISVTLLLFDTLTRYSNSTTVIEVLNCEGDDYRCP